MNQNQQQANQQNLQNQPPLNIVNGSNHIFNDPFTTTSNQNDNNVSIKYPKKRRSVRPKPAIIV
ncbi:1823_t:CDS:2 [Ambispora gerdemannii]|uniref:1823_t:CDS:1 n=1 Tax=Ambispora gerdemannii TaxID=144530 RepID=A0A9N9F6R8_9GLOM|nr:1823_t:CDS:2 [Ambispora gerdemannii]